jgi:hypothetical protein
VQSAIWYETEELHQVAVQTIKRHTADANPENGNANVCCWRRGAEPVLCISADIVDAHHERHMMLVARI